MNDKFDISLELKLKEIDQLDSAIIQFSKNTMQAKKICAASLIGVSTLILAITDNIIDYSIIWCSFLTILTFWITDAIFYYYQIKLRLRMINIIKEIKSSEIINEFGMPIKQKNKASWLRSLFNLSQIFYFILSILIFIFYILLKRKIINL